MNRFAALTVSVLAFMACTALKEADEASGFGHAGDKSYAGADRGGSQQSGSGGAAGNTRAGDGSVPELGGAGAGLGGATLGGAGDGGAGDGGAGDGGAGDGGEGNQPPVAPCGSAVETEGKTFYFCACDEGADARCVAGSDATAGTDEQAPLRSYGSALALFETLEAGDTLAFCRGGAWDAESSRRWSNAKCTAEAPCTIRDYPPSWDSDGSASSPRINAGDGLGLHFFGGSGFQLLNFELRGSNLGLSVEKGVSDVLLCGLLLDGFDHAAHLSDGGGATTHVVLRESTIRNTKHSSLPISSPCNDCLIESNTFEQNGLATSDGPYDTIYISAGEQTHPIQIRNNVFRTESDGDHRCVANSIVLEGDAADGASIEGNLIEDLSADEKVGRRCGAIAFGGAGDARAVAATIRGNRWHNVGASAANTVFCDDCLIENNIVSRTRTLVDLDGNLLNFTPFNTNGSTDGLIIRNNTVFSAEGVEAGQSVIIGFWQGSPYPGFVSANNLVSFRGTTTEFVFMQAPPTRSFAFVDNNLCFYPNVPSGLWTPQGTLSEWSQSDEGHDTHSIYGDPQIIELEGPNFLAPSSATSRIVGKGSPTQAPPTDIYGKPRHPTPDIGAIEH